MERLIKTKNFIADAVIYAAEYILALFILLECNSVYGAVVGKIELLYSLQQSIYFYGAAALIALVIRRRFRIKDLVKDAAVLVVLCIVLLIYHKLVNTDKYASIDFVRMFFMFFPLIYGIFVLERHGGRPYQPLYALADVTFFLAAASLMTWVHVQFFHGVGDHGSLMIAWGEGKEMINVANLGFFWQRDWTFIKDGSLYRNIGIFKEAPAYVAILSSALATELYLRKSVSVIRVVVLSAAVISTISMLGILILLGAWGLKFLQLVPKTKKTWAILGAAAILLVVLTVVFLIRKQQANPGSFRAHIADYDACYNAWKEHPLLGLGWNREDLVGQYFNPPRQKYGIATTAGLILAVGGTVLFLFYLLPFAILWALGLTKKREGTAQWALVVFMLYCVIIFQSRFLTTFLAFGYAMWSELFAKKVSDGVKADIVKKPAFCIDKASVVFLVVAILLTCFFMLTSFLESHELLLEQQQWAFIYIIAYSLWGVGFVRAGVEHFQRKTAGTGV